MPGRKPKSAEPEIESQSGRVLSGPRSEIFRRAKTSPHARPGFSKSNGLDVETCANPAEHFIVRESLCHPGKYLSDESNANRRFEGGNHDELPPLPVITSVINSRRRDSFTRMSRCEISFRGTLRPRHEEQNFSIASAARTAFSMVLGS